MKEGSSKNLKTGKNTKSFTETKAKLVEVLELLKSYPDVSGVEVDGIKVTRDTVHQYTIAKFMQQVQTQNNYSSLDEESKLWNALGYPDYNKDPNGAEGI